MNSKRIPLGVILFALLGGGCTTSKFLPPQAPPVAFREANDKLAGRNAQVRTRDGGLFELYGVEITADSVRGLSPFGGAGSQFAYDEVFEIKTNKDRTRGALVGGAVGAAIGLFLILLAESVGASSQSDEPAAGLAIGAAGWGAIIGAIRGTRTQYRFGR